MEERTLLSVAFPCYPIVYPGASGAPSVQIAPLSSSGPVGLTPAQVRAAFGIDQIKLNSIVGDGNGQTIAIVDAYDNPALVDSTDPNFINSNLYKFDHDPLINLPDPPSFLKLDEYGNPITASHHPPTDPAGTGYGTWGLEESLDVEWAHAIAPAANIILFEANAQGGATMAESPDLNTAVKTAANYPGVSVVSMSWGCVEDSSDPAYNATFTTPAGHQGVTFLAGSGDTGSPAMYPALSPNVVAVGGTFLTLSGNNYASETAWDGSGGGPSAYENAPSYQNGVQSSGYRQTPDVAFDASPDSGAAVYDSYDFGASLPWDSVGGTSLSSPCWAGLIAIADQLRTSQGLGSLDGPSQTLPALYSLPTADFHDITSGSNGTYSAGPGYDEVTGLGTPVANTLVPDLVFGVPPTVASAVPSLSGGTLPAGSTTLAVNFSEIALGAGAAANFKLQTAGPDGLLGTADDLVIPLSATSTGVTATLTFPPLAEDVYRLTVSDAITNTLGVHLDGNGDGHPGGNWTADFVVVTPSNGFAAAASFSTGLSRSAQMATVDFNGDGVPDLAVTDNSPNGGVAVLLGDGNGGFSAATVFQSGGSSPYGIAVGDFNGDGIPDLAVTNEMSGTIGILLGNGKGGFSAPAVVTTGGMNPVGIAVSDFNGDGRDDLAVTIANSGVVAILLGNGKGGFSAPTVFQSGGMNPAAVAVGDFNGDGRDDLAVANANNTTSGTVGILLGDGTGRFSGPTTIAVGPYPVALALGDFNGDGKLDLAVANSGFGGGGATVTLLTGKGNGSFSASTVLNDSPDYTPDGIIAGDFNGDGKLDLAFANGSSVGAFTVGLLYGDGSGSFSAPMTFVAGSSAFSSLSVRSLAAGDFNGDGKLDLAVVNGLGTIGVLDSNNPSWVTLNSAGGLPFDIAVGTFGAGELIQGPDDAFDGYGRLMVDGTPYQPSKLTYSMADNGQSVITGGDTVAGLTVSREITVPDSDGQDFARTVDTFTNSSGSPITATVQIVGNLGSDANTTVFATSDGTGVVSPNDQWIGTDDGAGTPAIIHYIHGPLGLKPSSVSLVGDNIQWTYNLTVPAGQTVRLAYLTILSTTRAGAVAAADALASVYGFGGQAAAFLTPDELSSLGNFVFPQPLPGDANLDGKVDFEDLIILLTNFGKSGMTWSQGNFAGDATVDIEDLTILLTHFDLNIGAPSVSVGNAGAVTFVAGAAPVAVAPNLAVTDPESNTLASATVAISGGPLNTGAELLAATTAGTHITASYSSTAAILSLSGTDTLADYDQVLQSVTYVDTLATTATLGDRTLLFAVSDGILASASATGTVDVTALLGGANKNGPMAKPATATAPNAPTSSAKAKNVSPLVMASGIETPGATLGWLPCPAAYDAVLQSGAWDSSASDPDGLDGLLAGFGGNQQTF